MPKIIKTQEKNRINKMLKEGVSMSEVSRKTGRSLPTIRKMKDALDNPVEEPMDDKTLKIIEETKAKIIASGYEAKKADLIIKRTLRKHTPTGVNPFFIACMSNIRAIDNMNSTSGAIAMTENASAMADETKRRGSDKVPMRHKNCIWQPKDGRMR